jgi:hypothetical protein
LSAALTRSSKRIVSQSQSKTAGTAKKANTAASPNRKAVGSVNAKMATRQSRRLSLPSNRTNRRIFNKSKSSPSPVRSQQLYPSPIKLQQLPQDNKENLESNADMERVMQIVESQKGVISAQHAEMEAHKLALATVQSQLNDLKSSLNPKDMTAAHVSHSLHTPLSKPSVEKSDTPFTFNKFASGEYHPTHSVPAQNLQPPMTSGNYYGSGPLHQQPLPFQAPFFHQLSKPPAECFPHMTPCSYTSGPLHSPYQFQASPIYPSPLASSQRDRLEAMYYKLKYNQMEQDMLFGRPTSNFDPSHPPRSHYHHYY